VIQTPVRQDLYVVSARSVRRSVSPPSQGQHCSLQSSTIRSTHNAISRHLPPWHPPPPKQNIIRALISSSVQGKQDRYYSLRLSLFTRQCLPTAADATMYLSTTVHATVSAYCCSRYSVPAYCRSRYNVSVHCCSGYSVPVYRRSHYNVQCCPRYSVCRMLLTLQCLVYRCSRYSVCPLLFTHTKLHTPTTEANNCLDRHVFLSAPQQAGT
jgi:hypothetical protein